MKELIAPSRPKVAERVCEMRNLLSVAAVDGGALERDLQVGERRVDVVVFVEHLVWLRDVRLKPHLQLKWKMSNRF